MGTVITPVILSGGSGTRLWPLSLPEHPKQLHAFVGDDTMIQATARRLPDQEGVSSPMVVCNEPQSAAVIEQLVAVGSPPETVVVEPVARNTAPAVAAAALLIDPDVVMVVLPADHMIADSRAFESALEAAVAAAEQGFVVTFGVVPTRPETGFGYIEVGHRLGETAEVRRFVEKPDASTAAEFVASGYLWNSGMFSFTAARILEELRRWEPELVKVVEEAVAASVRDDSLVRLGEAFGAAPGISIDHAVMERTDRARVVELDAGWSDVGSWQALWEVVAPNGGTITVGAVHAVDVEGSYIRSESRPVAVIGVNDVVVVETPQAVLVVDRGRTQDVRRAAEWFTRLREGER